jgi:hypothetical protein
LPFNHAQGQEHRRIFLRGQAERAAHGLHGHLERTGNVRQLNGHRATTAHGVGKLLGATLMLRAKRHKCFAQFRTLHAVDRHRVRLHGVAIELDEIVQIGNQRRTGVGPRIQHQLLSPAGGVRRNIETHAARGHMATSTNSRVGFSHLEVRT